MTRHEATFDIRSKSDARAVRLLVGRAYDTLREELQGVDRGSDGANEMLHQFEAIREATRDPSPGTLTIAYESENRPFED